MAVVATATQDLSMSSIYTSNVQLGTLPTAGTIYTCDVQFGVQPGHVALDSGAITVTAEAGVTIAGLVVGNSYSVEATGGWWDNGIGSQGYAFAVSNDGGSSWSGEMGWDGFFLVFLTNNPAWSTGLVNLDGLRARMFWKATTTSIKIRVADAPGAFADNGGSLGWALREGLGIFTSGVRLG